MNDDERSHVMPKSLAIPLFSAFVNVMNMCSAILKAYCKESTVRGEPYTIGNTKLHGGRVYHFSDPLMI